jgi:hypothetical protein
VNLPAGVSVITAASQGMPPVAMLSLLPARVSVITAASQGMLLPAGVFEVMPPAAMLSHLPAGVLVITAASQGMLPVAMPSLLPAGVVK